MVWKYENKTSIPSKRSTFDSVLAFLTYHIIVHRHTQRCLFLNINLSLIVIAHGFDSGASESEVDLRSRAMSRYV